MLELSKELSLCIHGGSDAPIATVAGSIVGITIGMAVTFPYLAIIRTFRSLSPSDLVDLLIFAGTPFAIGTSIGLVLDTL